jgi:hypothetical protein
MEYSERGRNINQHHDKSSIPVIDKVFFVIEEVEFFEDPR